MSGTPKQVNLSDFAYGKEAARILGVKRPDSVWRIVNENRDAYYVRTGRVITVEIIGSKKLVLRTELELFAKWYRSIVPKQNRPYERKRVQKPTDERHKALDAAIKALSKKL